MSDLAAKTPIEPESEEIAFLVQKGPPSTNPAIASMEKVLPESIGLAKRIAAGLAAIDDAEDKLPVSAVEGAVSWDDLGDLGAALTAIEEALG